MLLPPTREDPEREVLPSFSSENVFPTPAHEVAEEERTRMNGPLSPLEAHSRRPRAHPLASGRREARSLNPPSKRRY